MVSHKHFFLSHSGKDAHIAKRLCESLERKGVSCWIAPRNIGPGQNYGHAIIEAIEECAALVVLVSKNANVSNHVAQEVERAASKDKVIIPCRIEDVQPGRSLELFVSSSQWVDLSEESLDERAAELAQTARQMIENNHAQTERDGSDASFSPVSPAKVIQHAEEIEPGSCKAYVGLAYPLVQTGYGYLRIVWDASRHSVFILKNTRLDRVIFPLIDPRYVADFSARVITPISQWREGDFLNELLPFVEGWTLHNIMRLNTGIYGEILTQWTIQLLDIANVLQKHVPPLVHRDIKPSNIMVLKQDLSLVLIDTTTMLPLEAATGAQPIGSEGYAAPEIARTGSSFSSDLYAIGCTIYAMNTCSQPPTPLQRQRMGAEMVLKNAEEKAEYLFKGLVSLKPASRFKDARQALDAASKLRLNTAQTVRLGELLLPNGETFQMEGFIPQAQMSH